MTVLFVSSSGASPTTVTVSSTVERSRATSSPVVRAMSTRTSS